MAQAKSVIPSFIQGISTQAETQRARATAQDILNGYPDPAVGLRKRNGIQFKHELNVSAPTLPYSYHFLQTAGKRFVMFLTQDATEPIQVFDLDTATKSTVVFDDASALTYLNQGTGNKRWRVLSIFDSTLIVNTTVVTALKGAASPYTVNRTVLDIAEIFDSGTPTAGHIYKTLNSSVGRPAGFYQAKTPYSATDPDNFIRLPSPSALSDIDETTMPVQMVYNSGTNTFNVKHPDWRPRFSGDELTNPGPSFIGRRLVDIVFRNNRLWLFADEVVVSSRAGSFFNFWVDDVSNQTPDDPIDEFLSDEGLNKIIYVTPFNESLIIFTEGDRQFEVRSVGRMAPDSVAIIPTTNYGVSRSARPVRVGNSLFFLTPYTDYGQVMEYYYIENAASNVARDASEHVKNLILDDIANMTAEVNNGLLLLHGANSDRFYTYRAQWGENEKVQSAWTRWQLCQGIRHKIQTTAVFTDDIWILLRDVGPSSTKFSLATLPVVKENTFAALPYPVHLDMHKTFASGTYEAVTNTTYWDLPYAATNATIRVVRTTGDKAGLSLESETEVLTEHVTRVRVTGNLASTQVCIGAVFDFLVQFNPPYLKSQDGSVITGSFALQKLIVYARDLIQFNLEQRTAGVVTPYGATYSAVQTGSNTSLLDVVPLKDFDNPSFIILGKADETTITLYDSSEFPLTLVSAEFKGNFTPMRVVK